MPRKAKSSAGQSAGTKKEMIKVRVVPVQKKRPKPRQGAVKMTTQSGRFDEDFAAAPVAIGRNFRPSQMSMTSNTQKVCDAGHCASVRISGTDFIQSFRAGGQTGNAKGLVVGGAVVDGANLAPNEISSRVGNLCGFYSWYAIRELEIEMIPTEGTSTSPSTTTFGAGSLYGFAIVQNATADVSDGPTNLQQVGEVDPSCVHQLWRGGSLRYRYDGTKVWSTSNSGAAVAVNVLDFQLRLAAYWDVAPLVTAVSLAGGFRVRYVIDLYRPQEPTSAISLRNLPPSREAKLTLFRQLRESLFPDSPDWIDTHSRYDDEPLRPPTLVRESRAREPSPSASVRNRSRPPAP